MNKFKKFVVYPIAGVIALLLVAIFVLLAVIDPNRYKPTLESAFARQTGLIVQIVGDISWTFRPVFGLNVNDVRVTNGISPQELVSFSNISLRVAPASMVRGPVQVEEFIANDFHINWIVDANGVNNWFPEGFDTVVVDDTSTNTEQSDITTEIQLITIRNARIGVQDVPNGINSSIENLDFTSRDTNFSNRPFPFQVSFRLLDNMANRDLRIRMNSTAAIDYAAGNASFEELELSLSPLILSGAVAANDFHENLSWSGALSSNTFNLTHLLETLMPPPQDTELVLPGTFDYNKEQFAMQLSFAGDGEGISIPALALSLDEARAHADIEYRYATGNRSATLVYRVDANALDLNNYFGATAETPTEEETAAAPAVDIEIPVELLNSLNIIGNHSIESLAIAGLNFTDINAQLTLNEGILNIETQPVGLYEGHVATVINLDARAETPELNVSAALEGVDLAGLVTAMPLANFARGVLATNSEYSLSGTTVEQMLASMQGATSFSLTENSVDIGLLKQVMAAISALSPSGEIASSWPDTLNFNQFDGYVRFTDGLSSGQELQVRMDNFEINGTGGIDLAAERFDYRTQFTALGEPALQTIPVNETYQGIAWPVQCSGAFNSEPRQYCGPDFQQVRELFASIARNEVQRRVQDAVTDNVPEELQDTARGLLRNILRQN